MPGARTQVVSSLAEHPQATMSSITLNVSAVKLKYMAHLEELDKLSKCYHVIAAKQMLGRKARRKVELRHEQ